MEKIEKNGKKMDIRVEDDERSGRRRYKPKTIVEGKWKDVEESR